MRPACSAVWVTRSSTLSLCLSLSRSLSLSLSLTHTHTHTHASLSHTGLACGADANGSGAAAVLALLRLFGLLYDDAAARGRYDLLFVLTAGAPLNFQGTQHWVDSIGEQVLDSVEMVLCLDSIGGWGGARWRAAGGERAEGEEGEEEEKEGGLTLHISKREDTDSPMRKLFTELRSVAAQVRLVHLNREPQPPASLHSAWTRVNLNQG
jgi:hypothetical protein